MTLRWIVTTFVDVSFRFQKLRGFASIKTFLKALQQRAPADLDDTERKAA